jgi:hypothetical protein
MLSCDVPGVSSARSIQRRDATGRSWICWFDTLVETVECVTSTIGDSPVTVSASVTALGLSVNAIVAVWSITSTMSGRVSEEKPESCACSEYTPGGSAGSR